MDNTTRRHDPDEREFDDYACTQDAVELDAALWATRREAGLDAAGEAEFAAWLAADPAHAAAYGEMTRSFERVRALPGDAVRALKAGLAESAAESRASATPPATPSAPRRGWLDAVGSLLLPRLATAVIVLAVAGGGWLGWAHWYGQPVFTADYATGRGQRLAVDLPDGSVLQLDTATRIEVRLYRKRREVHLADGQVMFDVAGDGVRPFAVLAGAARVTVVGTRFSVRHTQAGLAAGQTVVAVESGTVRVAGDRLLPSGTAGVALTAGQGVSAGRGGQLAPVVSFPAEGVGAWRNGRVSFDDTPLSDALAEFERYEDTGLVVRDPRVGALRLGGSFDLRQARTFAQTLPLLLPVRLEQRGTEIEIVALDQAD